MTNLRAYVTTATLAAAILSVSSIYADGIAVPSAVPAQYATPSHVRGGILDATPDYLLIDVAGSSYRKVWSVRDNAYVGIETFADVGAITGNAKDGYVATGVYRDQVYQWSINGKNATKTALGAADVPVIFGSDGTTHVGSASYWPEWANGDSVDYATYWRGGNSYILPDAAHQGVSSLANGVHGNLAVGNTWNDNNRSNATAWRIPSNNGPATHITLNSSNKDSEAYAVSGNLIGGNIYNNGRNATAWRLDPATDAVREINLHPQDFKGSQAIFSEITDVASQVQFGESKFDIAVGNIQNIIGDWTAALWVLTDNVLGADGDYQIIELTSPSDISLVESHAMSIVINDGQLDIYGYGITSYDASGETIPLVWHMENVGAQVPEAMTASLLLAGTCGLFLRRPRRA